MEATVRAALDAFARVHGKPAACAGFAPGRVEVLGNHTDHNGGCVLSVALDLGVAVAAARASSEPATLNVWSEAFGEGRKFPLDDIAPERGSWTDYVRGVILEIRRSGVEVGGLKLAIASSLPIGAGVSSSAALELAAAEAVYGLFGGRPQDPMEVARLCQRAEVSFVGVPCGLLDQFSSAFGKKDQALFLDCATLRHRRVPLGRDDIAVVLADSGEKHALVDGKYAEIRRSCERAARGLEELLGRPLRFLRDVTLAELLEHAEALEPEDRRRAEHVIRENERVIRGLAAIGVKHSGELSRLMLESHASSRDLLGNSTSALDFLVDAAAGLAGFLGGKLTGGGFGGSTVNIVERAHAPAFTAELQDHFVRKFGRRPRVITAGIGDGARVVALGDV